MQPRPNADTVGPAAPSCVVWTMAHVIEDSRRRGRNPDHETARGKPDPGQIAPRAVGRVQRCGCARPSSRRVRGDPDHPPRSRDRRRLGGRASARHGADRAGGVGDEGDPDRRGGGRGRRAHRAAGPNPDAGPEPDPGVRRDPGARRDSATVPVETPVSGEPPVPADPLLAVEAIVAPSERSEPLSESAPARRRRFPRLRAFLRGPQPAEPVPETAEPSGPEARTGPARTYVER